MIVYQLVIVDVYSTGMKFDITAVRYYTSDQPTNTAGRVCTFVRDGPSLLNL